KYCPSSFYHVIYLLLSTHMLTFIFFFFNDPATTEIYTLSLHDALPISSQHSRADEPPFCRLSRSHSCGRKALPRRARCGPGGRSGVEPCALCSANRLQSGFCHGHHVYARF